MSPPSFLPSTIFSDIFTQLLSLSVFTVCWVVHDVDSPGFLRPLLGRNDLIWSVSLGQGTGHIWLIPFSFSLWNPSALRKHSCRPLATQQQEPPGLQAPGWVGKAIRWCGQHSLEAQWRSACEGGTLSKGFISNKDDMAVLTCHMSLSLNGGSKFEHRKDIYYPSNTLIANALLYLFSTFHKYTHTPYIHIYMFKFYLFIYNLKSMRSHCYSNSRQTSQITLIFVLSLFVTPSKKSNVRYP